MYARQSEMNDKNIEIAEKKIIQTINVIWFTFGSFKSEIVAMAHSGRKQNMTEEQLKDAFMKDLSEFLRKHSDIQL